MKQKTAYEVRISDWSSDVCSSDIAEEGRRDEIDKLFSTEKNQINILKKEITSLKSFQNDLEFIMWTVADYQINLAKNMIGKSSRDIQRFCTKLSPEEHRLGKAGYGTVGFRRSTYH